MDEEKQVASTGKACPTLDYYQIVLIVMVVLFLIIYSDWNGSSIIDWLNIDD